MSAGATKATGRPREYVDLHRRWYSRGPLSRAGGSGRRARSADAVGLGAADGDEQPDGGRRSTRSSVVEGDEPGAARRGGEASSTSVRSRRAANAPESMSPVRVSRSSSRGRDL